MTIREKWKTVYHLVRFNGDIIKAKEFVMKNHFDRKFSAISLAESNVMNKKGRWIFDPLKLLFNSKERECEFQFMRDEIKYRKKMGWKSVFH